MLPGNPRRFWETRARSLVWRINVGAEGSGVAVLMDRLIEANRLDPKALDLARLSTTPAVVELLQGTLDAMVFVSAPESPMVQMLLILICQSAEPHQ